MYVRKDGQLALDYILENLKQRASIISLENIIASRETAFNSKYRDVDEDAIADAWLNLFLDGWIGLDPNQYSGDWLCR